MTDVQRAYIAALLEGEGCFMYAKQRGTSLRNPRIVMGMTDEDIVERFSAIVGIGNIHAPKKQKDYHKQHYVWSCSGKKAFWLMKEVLPFMGVRRTAKIKGIMRSYLEERNYM